MVSDNWVKLHTVESVFEADLLKDALGRDGIEYVIKEHKETAYDGLFILQKGYASFFVREEDKAAAQQTVDSIKKSSDVALPDD